MNHIYRVVYNAATNTYQAVPENSTGKHKTASEKSPCALSDCSEKGAFFSLKPMALFAMAMGLSSTGAWAAPTGGQISAGDASISQHGKITNIQQNSQKAAINWQTFGIKADETVNFKQPNAQAVILNRVIGNEKSVIDGAMNANGKVFISNPNGMIIGKNAQINVGALLATTAKIKDQDFMNGFFKFDEATGDITHLGDIKVPTGGVVALIAPIVANKGNITAPQGKVLLASAEQFSITLPDNGQFAYTLDRGTLQGLVDNGGAILADGGYVILTAKGTDAVKKSLIKHTGKIEANTVQNKNGVIELLGDLDNTRLEASGSLKAEAEAEQGDGGFVETSAAELGINDLQVSTQSKYGKTGTWLIDPKDFTVAPSGGDMTGKKVAEGLQANNVVLKSRDGAKEGKGDVMINDEISWDKNTLTLNADNDIHINKTLNGTGTAKLALEYGQGATDGGESDYHIKNGAAVHLSEGQNLDIKKGANGSTLHFKVIHSLPNKAKDYTFDHPFVAFGKYIDASNTKSLTDFDGFKTDSTNTKIHGLGNGISGLTINSSSNNVGLLRVMTGGEIRDLTLTNTNVNGKNNTGALAGISANDVNIKNITVFGNVAGDNYTGGIIGNGRYANLDNIKFIGNINGSNYVGGIAGVAQNISNIIVKDGKVTGIDFVGGLVGHHSGDINDSTTQDITVKGNDYVGGLVGNITGNHIKKSYTHNGTIAGNNQVGGLVGSSEQARHAYISEVYFSNGTVTGKNNVGGLSGYDIDDIYNAYVSGTITGENQVGGLVGDGLGYMDVHNAYFNGTINGKGKNVSNLFGVETYNYTYDKNYYNIDKTRPLGKYGQGKTLEQMKQKSTYEGWDFDTLWSDPNGVDTPRLRNIINLENLGASAATSINQAYLNNIPNKKYCEISNCYTFAIPERDIIIDTLTKVSKADRAKIKQIEDALMKSDASKSFSIIVGLTSEQMKTYFPLLKPEALAELERLNGIYDSAKFIDGLDKQSEWATDYSKAIKKRAKAISDIENYSDTTKIGALYKIINNFATLKDMYEISNKTLNAINSALNGDYNVGLQSDLLVASTKPLISLSGVGAASIATLDGIIFAIEKIDGGTGMEGALSMNIESVKNTYNHFNSRLNNIIQDLANGKIDKATAEKQFNDLKHQSSDSLTKINNDIINGFDKDTNHLKNAQKIIETTFHYSVTDFMERYVGKPIGDFLGGLLGQDASKFFGTTAGVQEQAEKIHATVNFYVAAYGGNGEKLVDMKNAINNVQTAINQVSFDTIIGAAQHNRISSGNFSIIQ